ncbi:MAG TPA: hypothetical protein VIJ42_11430 [Stellaceae bacterium]
MRTSLVDPYPTVKWPRLAGGGFLVHIAPNGVLKILLGAILIFSAWRTVGGKTATGSEK